MILSEYNPVPTFALGAKACLLGRAWAYALAGGGQAGVEYALTILEREMQVAMALTGSTSVEKLGPEILE